jgi:hypothetical protein
VRAVEVVRVTNYIYSVHQKPKNLHTNSWCGRD